MARYLITLKNGDKLEVDNAKFEGAFVKYITRGMHTIKAIPSDQIADIEKRDIGHEGGMRFTGQHDTSFRSTPGSI
jgi:hypothetical protein